MVLFFKMKHYDLSIQCSKLQKEKKRVSKVLRGEICGMRMGLKNDIFWMPF